MIFVFYDKVYEFKVKLFGIIEGDEIEQVSFIFCKEEDEVEGGKKIDVMKYFGKIILDVIGIVGFSYDFKVLFEFCNELLEVYFKMFQVGMDVNFWDFLRGVIFFVNKFVSCECCCV